MYNPAERGHEDYGGLAISMLMRRYVTALAAASAIAAAVTGVWWLAAAAAGLATAAALARDSQPVVAFSPSPLTPATPEPSDVVDALHRSAAPLVSVVCSHLWLRDPATGTFRRIAMAGETSPCADAVPTDDPSMGAGAVSDLASVVQIAGPSDGPDIVWRLAYPLGHPKQTGVACVDMRSANQPDVRRITDEITRLEPSLEAALRITVAREETAVARRLLGSAHDLSRRLRPDEVAASALDHAMALSEAVTGSVLLLDDTASVLRIASSRGITDEIVARTAIKSGDGIAGWVFATGKPLLVEDLPSRRDPRHDGVRSAVSVPIADGDGRLGVLSVGSRDHPARFTEATVSALGFLARQTAVALRNARAMESARDLYFTTLTALTEALETKDPYARGATRRVTDVVMALAKAFELGATDSHSLHVAALLHDIGMRLTSDASGKDRPLSTGERGLVQGHPAVAAEILADIPGLKEVVPIVYHHHEWYDGHGYVSGTAGESIPLGSRILAVADAFVAMTSDRPYRSAMTVRSTVDELNAKSGSQFDPDVVSTLGDILRRNPGLALMASGE